MISYDAGDTVTLRKVKTIFPAARSTFVYAARKCTLMIVCRRRCVDKRD